MTPAMRHLIRTLALVELGEATHEQLREALAAVDGRATVGWVPSEIDVAVGLAPRPRRRAWCQPQAEQICADTKRLAEKLAAIRADIAKIRDALR